ncbi:hypothetical protein [Acinetobacter calcoaceticus]|uniref:hypothetical protein n=1 Tax=Acinetobacter calcoaceticus TaxID=471 RepID=UPI001AE9E02A|nr:hypothetical protein [Acinetobacter calcoaceticus]MBP2605494.1 lipopolysaccharide export LptBFGC system permease protein LptF [Acinetobacter calcoaceticus]
MNQQVTSLDLTESQNLSEEELKAQQYLKKQQETLESLKVGGKDTNGYTIKNIYARGDEYLVYDTTEADIHQSMKVIIYTKKEVDDTLVQAYNKVKYNFDKLKTALYKSGDNPLNKQRIASALVIILHEPDKEAEVNKLFEEITKDLKEEYEGRLWGRLAYLCGALAITLLAISLAMYAYTHREIEYFKTNSLLLSFLYCSMFASIGGFFSVSLKSQSIFIMHATSKWMYFLYGLERNIIAVIAGLACFVLLSSEIIFSNIKDGNTGIFFMMSICFFSGFSEKFIPNALNTLTNDPV